MSTPYYKCRYLNALDTIKHGYNMAWTDKCIEHITYNSLIRDLNLLIIGSTTSLKIESTRVQSEMTCH